MSVTEWILLLWAIGNTLGVISVGRRASVRADGTEERLKKIEQGQGEILRQVRESGVKLNELATAREIEQAVEAAFARRISPRREEPPSTHFHGPVTAGPLAGGNIGRIDEDAG